MRHAVLPVLLVSIVSGCGSSDISTQTSDTTPGAGESSIVIAPDVRDTLPTLPNVAFNGVFQNTAPVDAVGGGGTDDRSETDGVLSTESGVTASPDIADSGGASSTSPPLIPRPPGQVIEPGTLTAGDYDDHLNPHLYQTYAGEYLGRRGQFMDVPRIDFNNRIQLTVTDKSSNPVPNVRIEVTGTGRKLSVHTAANGETSLYAELDALPDNFQLVATADDGTTVQQDINRQQALDSGQIQITLATTDQQQPGTATGTELDLMLVVDTTGSMTDELSFLQTELSDIIGAISAQQSGIKIGLVFYRDYGDTYIVRAHGFSDDLNAVQLNLNQEQARGGGDYPEAMDQALQSAMSAGWRSDSRKVMFLIADAPPHSDRMRATWNAAQQARQQNIHIVPIAASGVAEDAEYIMRSVAALTNSRYLFLTDDSGYGATHAEPEIDCYVVTSLRKTMIRTLNSLVTGNRTEPSDNDIIRAVGNYDNGRCDPSEQPDDPVNFNVLLERSDISNGSFTDKQIKTITSQDNLNTELTRYNESPMTVDFNNGKVLLIDMGQRSTGGYSLHLESVDTLDNYVQANIVYTQPGPGCAVTTALSNPFAFVYVSTQKEIRTVESTIDFSCPD